MLCSGPVTRFTEPADAGLPLGLTQLGVFSRIPSTVPLNPGDRMLFYTDGISEARNRSGEFYPLDRCGPLLAGQDPDAALDRLHDDVIRHVGHALPDDAAMLLVRSRPQPAGCQARRTRSGSQG